MSDHTPEHVRAPRRQQAAHIKELSTALLTAGVLHPAHVVAAASPTRLTSSDHAISHRILPMTSHHAAFDVPHRAGVLVFGSSRRPGGGWENGAKAQEEDLSLVSTWASQAAASTGFYKDNALAGPDLVLMAEGGWLVDPHGTPLDPPRAVVFAGIAAPNRADPHVAKMPALKQQQLLACRVLAALDEWERLHVDAIVLGAIGCGVFQWPAQESAVALRWALGASTWKGDLMLAMPDPAMAQIFSHVLSSPTAKHRLSW